MDSFRPLQYIRVTRFFDRSYQHCSFKTTHVNWKIVGDTSYTSSVAKELSWLDEGNAMSGCQTLARQRAAKAMEDMRLRLHDIDFDVTQMPVRRGKGTKTGFLFYRSLEMGLSGCFPGRAGMGRENGSHHPRLIGNKVLQIGSGMSFSTDEKDFK
jgi:hypothetical protein